jgi:hypothetical protein
MADVEPGRQRLRVKLPDGRDVTLEANEELKGRILAAIDRVVEIEVEEQLEGDVTTNRSLRGIEVLPSAGSGSDQPPQSIEELEREQNMPKERPDYQALASAIWETEEQVAEFEEHLREMRPAELS